MRAVPQANGRTLYDTADDDPPETLYQCVFCIADGETGEHAPRGFDRAFTHNGSPCSLRIHLCEMHQTLWDAKCERSRGWNIIGIILSRIAELRSQH